MSQERIDTSDLSPDEKRKHLKRILRERLSQAADGLSQAGRSEPATGKRGGNGEIPEEYYRFDQHPDYLSRRMVMEVGERMGVANPYYKMHEGTVGDTTTIGGKEYINYGNNNYLGLSGHPAVSQAATDAIDRYGTSVSASRVASGSISLHRELEGELAQALGVEDCILFSSGFVTNVTTVGHLFGANDLILHDALCHNSVLQGSVLSGARRVPFPHSDWPALENILNDVRCDYERVLIIIQGIYSMDGDVPDPRPVVELKRRHKTFLMIDDAHSMGALGEHGFGLGEHFAIDSGDVDIWMGTFSKTFASCGGYIAGCRALIENLRYSAPGAVFSGGLSPPNTAAALAAFQLMKAEPERIERLRSNGILFLELAKARGLDTGLSMGVNIIPVITGSSALAVMLSNALFERGISVPPILHPAVEESAARLRFFLSSEHTEEQIRYTVDVVAGEWQKLRQST